MTTLKESIQDNIDLIKRSIKEGDLNTDRRFIHLTDKNAVNAFWLAKIERESNLVKLGFMFELFKKHLDRKYECDKVDFPCHTSEIQDAINFLESKLKT